MFSRILSSGLRSSFSNDLKLENFNGPCGIISQGDLQKWESLTPTQQVQKVLGRFLKKIDSGALGLTPQNCMQMISRELGVTPEVARIVEFLVGNERPNSGNPAIREIIEVVARTCARNEPLQFVASFCLEKNPEVREGKLAYFLKGDRLPTPRAFATSASLKGWAQIKKIIDNVGYPVSVRFLHRRSGFCGA